MDARIFGITSFVFLAAWASPNKIHQLDFRSLSLSTTIVIDKSSPAVAALEDSRENFLEASAVHLDHYKIDKLQLLSILEEKKLAPAQPEIRRLSLVLIDQNPPVDHLAQLIASTLEDPAAPTAMELGEILVREELANRARAASAPNNNVREIKTSSGQNILVSKPVFVNAANFVKKTSTAKPPARQPREVASNEAKVIASKDSDKDKESSPSSASISPSGFTPSKPKRYSISGPLSFSGGVAFLGNRNTITANQIIDGLAMSSGIVDIKDAQYIIAVDDLDGEILAEVRNQEGQIMGQGRINLRALASEKSNIAKLEGFPLEVRPVYNGTSGTTISAASYGKNNYIVNDANVYVAGLSREVAHNKKTNTYEDESLAMPSTYVLRGVHEKFWPTLSFAESGEKFQLRLFPIGLVDALLNLSLDKYAAREAKNEAVIWGRVSMLGRAIEGAKVIILGDESNLANYFSGFIPDKTKSATASRGEFAFTRVKDAETLLQVSIGEKVLLPTLVPTESRNVTYADLEIETGRDVEIKSYDAFDFSPLAAALQPLGTKNNIYVPENGISQIKLNTVRGITLIESDPGEPYVVSRAALKANQTELHFSQIKKDWLDGMRGQIRTSENQNEIATSAVGLVNGDNYEVLIGDGSYEKNPNIIYFDSKGVVIGQHGIAGGGFAVFGLRKGLNTVTIIPDKSKKVVTQVIYVDEFATSLSRINLML